MKSNSVTVFIDSREKGKVCDDGTRASRASNYFIEQGCKVAIVNLLYGDYLFHKDGKEVIFEYKTVEDYVSSLYDGSLFEEAYNQSAEYMHSFVMMEGSFKEYYRADNDVNIEYKKFLKHMHGSIRRLRSFFCQYINMSSEEEAFNEMFQQSLKCFDEKIYGGCKRSLSCNDIVSYCLSGCNGVSHRLIENIKEQMPQVKSLGDLLNCSVDDFKQVHLIGDKKAINIYEWLHQKRI